MSFKGTKSSILIMKFDRMFKKNKTFEGLQYGYNQKSAAFMVYHSAV